MIRYFFGGIICLVILFSFQPIYAEEELSLPEGKNIKEWEAISAALMMEERYDEAIIYLDKIIDEEPDNLKALSNKAGVLIHLDRAKESLDISNKVLEIEPERVSTLQNKGVALRILGEHEMAFETFIEVVNLQPENVENVKKAMGRTLAEMRTVTTTNSPYTVHLQLKVSDAEGNLLAVFESSNSRYLPSKFLESWWDSLNKRGLMIHENGIQKWQHNGVATPDDDHLGMFTWETEMGGWQIMLFQIFVPMMQFEGTEKIETQWTVVKK